MCCTSSFLLVSILCSNIVSLALTGKRLLEYRGVDEGRDCFDECLKNRSSSSQANSICQQQCLTLRRKKRSASDQSTHYDCVKTSAKLKEDIGNITNLAAHFTPHRLQNGMITDWTANVTWDILYSNYSLHSSDAWNGFEINWVKGKKNDAKMHCRFINKSVTWTTIKMFHKSDFPLNVVVAFYPSTEYVSDNAIVMKKFNQEEMSQPIHSPAVTPSISDRVYYIAGSVSGGILLAVSLLILICIHRKRSFYSNLNPRDVTSKGYDTSIIFSSADEKFVIQTLLPFLENENHFKCCVHFRDWNPGENIFESMVNMVNNCKKVIAVISKHFMASKFCQQELDIALGRLASERDSIIIINLGVAVKDIPAPLQKKTFIDFTKSAEKKTWRTRLERQISRESSSGNGNVDAKSEKNKLMDGQKNHEYEESSNSNAAIVKALIHKDDHCHVNGSSNSCRTTLVSSV